MEVSMHNWMRAEPIEVTIARLGKSGYDAIEISGEPERYNTRDVGKLLKDHKISEDDERKGLDEIQKLTDNHVKLIDDAQKKKDTELLGR